MRVRFFALALLALACGDAPAASPGSQAAEEAPLEWIRVSVGMQVTRAEVVRSGPAKARGLSGRRTLPEGTGMLFVYREPGRYGFWMPDMHFDIDIIWIHRDRVVHIESRVPHDAEGGLPTYRPNAEADLILEVPAGTAERYGWQLGDPVGFDPAVHPAD